MLHCTYYPRRTIARRSTRPSINHRNNSGSRLQRRLQRRLPAFVKFPRLCSAMLTARCDTPGEGEDEGEYGDACSRCGAYWKWTSAVCQSCRDSQSYWSKQKAEVLEEGDWSYKAEGVVRWFRLHRDGTVYHFDEEVRGSCNRGILRWHIVIM